MLAGKADAFVWRHHVVAPAMHDQAAAGVWQRVLAAIAGQVKGGGQQEQSVGLQVCAGHGGDVAAHARAHQYQAPVRGQRGAQELRHPAVGFAWCVGVDSCAIGMLTVIDRDRPRAQVLGYLNEGADFGAQWAGFFAVGKDHQ